MAIIELPTVLVLGAGASQPFNYPTGQRLTKMIIDDILTRKSPFKINQMDGRELAAYSQFAQDFRSSGRYSIDAFLEHRSDQLDVGRAVIAYMIAKWEYEENLFVDQGNWYRWF